MHITVRTERHSERRQKCPETVFLCSCVSQNVLCSGQFEQHQPHSPAYLILQFSAVRPQSVQS